MSYEIYKNIKQNKDGSFDCVCASSNLFDARTGGKVFSKYHMTYFNEKFPTTNKKELRALWLLYSTWSGDKFYPTAWKDGQKLARKFIAEFKIDYEIFYKNPSEFLEYAKYFIEYAKKTKRKQKKYIVQFSDGSYISKLISCRRYLSCHLTFIQEKAKIFKESLEEMKEKLKFFNKEYSIIEVE